jgi:hypothetical protein
MKKKKDGLEFFGVHLAKEWADIVREHSQIYGRSLSGEIRQLIKEAVGHREATTHQFAKPKKK